MGISRDGERKNPMKDFVAGGEAEDARSYKNNARTMRNITYVLAAIVSLVTFLVYLPSLQNGFVNWDDDIYIYKNFLIRSFDAHLVLSAFTKFHAAIWHPLTWISHAFDYALWELNPLGHHLTSNILHALNTLLVVFLVMRLMDGFNKTILKDKQTQSLLSDRVLWIASTATGILFGLHPVHVESVAWVTERKDILCAFFYLLTIIAYTNYVREIDANAPVKSAPPLFRKTYLIVTGLFVLSLLSKSMAVTLPFVLLILDWYPYGRIRSFRTLGAVLLEKVPWIALSVVFSTITFLAQKLGGAMAVVEQQPLPLRLLVAAKSLAAYIGKMLMPVNLVPFYPYPKTISLFSLEFGLPLAIVATITLLCVGIARKQKLWLTAWSYYVLTLMPVLGIVQVGGQSMADRYTYLPSLGPFFLLGFVAAISYEKASVLKQRALLMKTAALSVALILITSLSYATVKQIGIWKDSITFWNYVIGKEGPTAPAVQYSNLAAAYQENGQLDMAIKQYRIEMLLEPNDPKAYNNLGIVYQSEGRLDEAREYYQTAIKLDSKYADAYVNLGQAYASQGFFDEAIKQLQTALRLNPDYTNAYYNLGVAYMSQGRLDMAIEQYRSAIRLDEGLVKAYVNLGTIYHSQGLIDMAIEQYQHALHVDSNDVMAHSNLGRAFESKGQLDSAAEHYQEALRLNPDSAEAYARLQRIYMKKGLKGVTR